MQSKTITVTAAQGTWVVRTGGAVIAESESALQLEEDGYPSVIYFPREDVEMAFLDPSDKLTTCPWKGDATHYSVVVKSGVLENMAWSYEDPKDDVARIKGHLAFYVGEKLAVEQL